MHGAQVDGLAQLRYECMQKISSTAGDLPHEEHVARGFDCHPIDVVVDHDDLDSVICLVDAEASLGLTCQTWRPPGMQSRNVSPTNQQPCLWAVPPLLRAVCLGNRSILQFLIDQGANIYAEDLHGMNAIMYAASAGQPSTLTRLLELTKSCKSQRERPPFAEYLVKRCRNEHNALELATYHAQRDCVRVLCASEHAGIDVVRWGAGPLHIACDAGDVETAAVLLNHGFDVNILSCGIGRMRRTSQSLGRLKAYFYTPILQASLATPCRYGMVLFLARRGADLSFTAENGQNLAQALLGCQHAFLSNKEAWTGVQPLFELILHRTFAGGQYPGTAAAGPIVMASKIAAIALWTQLTLIHGHVRRTISASNEAFDQAMLDEAIARGDDLGEKVLRALGAGEKADA